MTQYHLFDAVTVKTTGSTIQGQIIRPTGATSEAAFTPPPIQQWSVLLTGLGNCSATVVVLGSNDGLNFAQVTTIAVAATSADITPGLSGQTTNQGWQYYAAYVQQIAGTSASVQCLLNC